MARRRPNRHLAGRTHRSPTGREHCRGAAITAAHPAAPLTTVIQATGERTTVGARLSKMSRPRWSATVITAVVLVAFCAACTNSATAASLTQARARWTSNAPDHYRMTWYEHAMVGTTRIQVEVRAGHVVRINAPRDDVKLMPVTDLTVDSVFAELGRVQQQANKVVVTYDPRLGYPAVVEVDVDDHAIDDEHTFGIESLQVL